VGLILFLFLILARIKVNKKKGRRVKRSKDGLRGFVLRFKLLFENEKNFSRIAIKIYFKKILKR